MVNSILVPVFLYPLLLWLIITGLTYVMGRSEQLEVRACSLALPAADHPRLARDLREVEHVEVSPCPGDREQALAELRQGRLDAVLAFRDPGPQGASLARNYAVDLYYDGSRDRGGEAGSRLGKLLRDYRTGWLREQAREQGLGSAEWAQFEITRRNLASERQMGRFLMSLMVPLFLVIMVGVGSFYPAIDSTAGERERSTWETLMTVACPRQHILVAKFLYVATMGAAAGLLNLASVTLSLKAVFAPLLAQVGDVIEFRFPVSALPVLVLGSLLLALFAAAGMMVLAAFARTFKEGQAMVTPFYLALFLPVLLLQDPDLKLTMGLALVPVVNLMVLFRLTLSGSPGLLPTLVTFGVMAVTITLCLRLATFILRFEEVLVGSYDGSLPRFLRDRARRLRPGRIRP